MQTKTTLGFHLTPLTLVTVSIINKGDNENAVKEIKRNSH